MSWVDLTSRVGLVQGSILSSRVIWGRLSLRDGTLRFVGDSGAQLLEGPRGDLVSARRERAEHLLVTERRGRHRFRFVIPASQSGPSAVLGGPLGLLLGVMEIGEWRDAQQHAAPECRRWVSVLSALADPDGTDGTDGTVGADGTVG